MGPVYVPCWVLWQNGALFLPQSLVVLSSLSLFFPPGTAQDVPTAHLPAPAVGRVAGPGTGPPLPPPHPPTPPGPHPAGSPVPVRPLPAGGVTDGEGELGPSDRSDPTP